MKDKKELQNYAEAVMSSPGITERNLLFDELDALYRLKWTLHEDPEARIWGLHEVKTSSPFTNIKVATNNLSRSLPIVHIDPYGNDPDNKAEADKREKLARWWLSK